MKTLHGEHLWWTPKQNEGGCLSGNSRITNIKNSFISGYSGVFFIGVLDYGVYVLEEKADSDDGDSIFFYLVVDEEGSEMSKLSEAYSTKPDAEAAGKVKYKERQEARKNKQVTNQPSDQTQNQTQDQAQTQQQNP